MAKGHLWPEWWIDCGRCHDHRFVDGKRHDGASPANVARSEGWKLTRTDGWVCPDCRDGEKEPAQP